MLFAACSSPLGDDDDNDATSTPITDATAAQASATVASPATVPGAPSEAAPTPATGTAAVTATATSTAASRASTTPDVTATEEPLPKGGAELRIEDNAIIRIVPGGDSEATLYATADESLWRSNDGGRTWSDAGEGGVGSLAVALNDQDILYSGDRGGCGRGFSFFEFRRSSDGGRSWETIPANKDFEPFLAYEESNAAYLYGSNCGLSVSIDGASTWASIPDLNGEEIFAVATDRDDPLAQIIVAAATEGGTGRLFLFDTTDPGRPQFISTLLQYWGDAALDWDDGRLVVAHAHQVGVSDDGGETWSWSRTGLEDATYSVDPLFEPLPESEFDPFRRIDFVRIDPTDPDRIWLGGSRGAYLSVDGGKTWDRVGDVVAITGIALLPLTDRVYISSAAGTRLWELDES